MESTKDSIRNGKRTAQSYESEDNTKKDKQTAQSYQTRWRAHWRPSEGGSTVVDKAIATAKKASLATSVPSLGTWKDVVSSKEASPAISGPYTCMCAKKASPATLWPFTGYWGTCISAKDASPFLGSSKQPQEKNKLEKGKAVMFPSSDLSGLHQDWFHDTTGGHPVFSQTIHSMFMTKNDVFKQTTYFGHGNRGVKIQSLNSSSNSQGQENVKDIGAGTSAINIESSIENFVANSTLPDKEKGTNLLPLRDMNLTPPVDPPAPGPSSSNTQSLNLNALSNHPDPTPKWAKRLKVTSPDSTDQDTKISNLFENYDKELGILRKMLKSNITSSSSEPTPRMLSTIEERGKELSSSPVWTKSWLRNGSQLYLKKAEVCEPQIL